MEEFLPSKQLKEVWFLMLVESLLLMILQDIERLHLLILLVNYIIYLCVGWWCAKASLYRAKDNL